MSMATSSLGARRRQRMSSNSRHINTITPSPATTAVWPAISLPTTPLTRPTSSSVVYGACRRKKTGRSFCRTAPSARRQYPTSPATASPVSRTATASSCQATTIMPTRRMPTTTRAQTRKPRTTTTTRPPTSDTTGPATALATTVRHGR